MSDSLVIPRYSDWHGHARDGETLRRVFGPSFGQCHWVLLMPNIGKLGLRTVADVLRYHMFAQERPPGTKPYVWPTLKVGPWTTPEDIMVLKLQFPRSSGKLYPDGVTTNSADGVSDFMALRPVYAAMEEYGVPLNVHGEMPGSMDDRDRESRFMSTLVTIVSEFPQLKIILEHISTAEAVEVVRQLPSNVAATITAHHPLLTYHDAIASGHNFCKPVAKTEGDREAVMQAMLSGDTKFFFGSDSAPHPPVDKQGSDPRQWSAGIYSGPVALQLIAGMFSGSSLQDWRERLIAFTCHNGCDFYGVDRPGEGDTITLVRDPWIVPPDVNGFVPFMAGDELEWQYA